MMRIKQKGAALIMALLVVAIVAAIAAALVAGEQIAIKRTEFVLNADQAHLDLAYATPWMLNRLEQLDKDFKQDAKMPTWPQQFQTTLPDNSQIDIQFSPAGMRFNLNNLALPVSNYNTIFLNLLQMADQNMSDDQAKTILQNVQDELFAKNKHLANNPNAVGYIVSPSQLRLVDGISSSIYQALTPYLIAVPDNNLPFNINAVPEYLLVALLGKDRNAANAVIEYRHNNGSFINPGIFLGLPAVAPLVATTPAIAQMVNVQADKYYLAHITITRDQLQYQWYSVLQYVATSQTLTTLYVGSSL
jgi:general secretion pathway protein K